MNVKHNQQKLQVNQGILEYIVGINPSTEWANRGFKATNYQTEDMSEFQEHLRDQLKGSLDLEDSEKSEKLTKFIHETNNVYDQLLDRDFESIKDRLSHRDIYFITGPPRTGGTYLLKALFELSNDRVTNYNHKNIFDYLPRNTLIGESYGGDHSSQVLYEWAQWIVWTSERFDLEKFNFIPKKHIGMQYQLDLFDEIFGDMANFIITTRHPAEAYQSYVERFFPNGSDENVQSDVGLWKHSVLPRTNLDEEQWEELDTADHFALYWCACYLEVLNYGKPENLEVLTFGEDYSRFLQQFANDQNRIYFPENFQPTPREELPEFSDECEQMRRKVEDLWEQQFDKPLY